MTVNVLNQKHGENWSYYHGDCIQVMPALPDASVDLCIHSPPFSSLYIYSDSEADMGNSATKDEFFTHYAYVIRELLRITVPGRCCAVHVKDLPLFKNRDGEMGVDPFSDDVTAAFRREGWIFQSRITIEKDPVLEMEKTNSHGLLFANWEKRGEILRTGLPDYVLIFQKPGACPNPVRHDTGDRTYFGANPPADWQFMSLPSRKTGKRMDALAVWRRYANPNWDDVIVPMAWMELPPSALDEAIEACGNPLVWDDIRQTEVLNKKVAKDAPDERHLCPLQTDLIDRLIHWKSNPGDVVFDPFGGIASTPAQALRLGRRGLGIELKESYWKLGVKELETAAFQLQQPTLFSYAEQQAVNE